MHDDLLKHKECELLFNTTENIQGKRLKLIRTKILKMTRNQFAHWLFDGGLTGNFKEQYSKITISSWEAGNRAVPEDVKQFISENVNIGGYKVQYAYLNGDSPYITKSLDDVLETSYLISEAMDEITGGIINFDEVETDEKQQKIDNIRFIALADLLPIYDLDHTDIFDNGRFGEYMYHGIEDLIYDYIEKEKKGL